MSRQDMITAIVNSIQTDSNLLLLLRLLIINNIVNVTDAQLTTIMSTLGIPNG